MFGPRSAKPPPEPEPEDDLERELSAMERVVAHRALGLLELGFTLPQVLKLAHTPDVLNEAQKLIEAGCPVEIAFDLLS